MSFFAASSRGFCRLAKAAALQRCQDRRAQMRLGARASYICTESSICCCRQAWIVASPGRSITRAAGAAAAASLAAASAAGPHRAGGAWRRFSTSTSSTAGSAGSGLRGLVAAHSQQQRKRVGVAAAVAACCCSPLLQVPTPPGGACWRMAAHAHAQRQPAAAVDAGIGECAAVLDAAPKAHTSALCLIPPAAAWEAIQQIRWAHDKSFVRWPPHINVLYPFLADEPSGAIFEAAAARAHEALQGVAPFELRLESFGKFDHRGSSTVWVDPAHPGPAQVHAALLRAFPQCSDLSSDPSRGITAFAPHLSVGQWRDGSAAEAAISELAAAWPAGGVTFPVASVALISRPGYADPFRLRWVVPLGGLGAPVRVDAPYVASVERRQEQQQGQQQEQQQEQQQQQADKKEGGPNPYALAKDFGLGTPPDAVVAGSEVSEAPVAGVWTFAFGANMAPSKLAARGVTPLDSRPAALPNHRLLFDHRGGFGNIEPTAEPTENTSSPSCKQVAGAPTPGTNSSSDVGSSSESGNRGASSSGQSGQTGQQGSSVSLSLPPAPSGDAVHGVLHRLQPADLAALTCDEHEYWPLVVEAHPYDGSPPAPAVAFASPPDRRTAPGLPPPSRYLSLLREGASHWGLDKEYCAWLDSLPSVESGERGAEYYTCGADGKPMAAWPKKRTGGRQQQRRGGGGRGGGGRGRGGGRGGGRRRAAEEEGAAA